MTCVATCNSPSRVGPCRAALHGAALRRNVPSPRSRVLHLVRCVATRLHRVCTDEKEAATKGRLSQSTTCAQRRNVQLCDATCCGVLQRAVLRCITRLFRERLQHVSAWSVLSTVTQPADAPHDGDCDVHSECALALGGRTLKLLFAPHKRTAVDVRSRRYRWRFATTCLLFIEHRPDHSDALRSW
jgi:hypothetical protein